MAETLQSWILLFFTATVISALNNEGWTADVKRRIDESFDTNVVIPCRFSYPPKYRSNDVQVFWKKDVTKKKSRDREARNPFIFHPDPSKVMESYRGRTALVGNVNDGNCSLQINKTRNDESDLYLRVHVGENYSFYNSLVSISVTGAKAVGAVTLPAGTRPETIPPAVTEINPFPDATHQTTSAYLAKMFSESATTQRPATKLHLLISVPIAAALIAGIASVTVFVLCRKYGRSRSIERDSSGYYANFSRTTMNQTKNELPGLTQGVTEERRVKVIDDEPVYNNIQSLSYQHSGPMGTEESIYANV